MSRVALVTTCYEVANFLNARPLSPLPASPAETEPITPGDFIFGLAPPQKGFVEHGLTRRRERLWQTWTEVYLASLKKWRTNPSASDEPTIGEIVLVREKIPRGLWPLGRVTGLIRGRDGVVRAVKLKIRGTATRRDVRLLHPLESLPRQPALVDVTPTPPSAGQGTITRTGRVSKPPLRY